MFARGRFAAGVNLVHGMEFVQVDGVHAYNNPPVSVHAAAVQEILLLHCQGTVREIQLNGRCNRLMQ